MGDIELYMVKVELKNMFNLLIIMRDKSYINYVTVSEAMFFPG